MMFTAYRDYWKNYGNFKGRTNRSQYWYVFMLSAFIGISWLFLIQLIKTMMLMLGAESEFGITIFSRVVLLLWAIITFTPSFAMTARRLRDARFEWGLMIITMMPSALLVTYWIFWIIVSLVKQTLSPFDEGDIGLQTGVFRLSLWFFAMVTNIIMIILCSQPTKDQNGRPVGLKSQAPYQGQPVQGTVPQAQYWMPQQGLQQGIPGSAQPNGVNPQVPQPPLMQEAPQQATTAAVPSSGAPGVVDQGQHGQKQS